MIMFISAPAKVNLSLYITGKRDDGYHCLVTRMQKLDLCDRLELELTDCAGIEFLCDSEDVPADDSNLAVKAAMQYFDRSDTTTGSGLRIRLTKNIPVGAGLGGGSSDAAAVLKGLNLMFDKPLADGELMDMGSELGADVPFFVSDYSAVIATGIGDKLEMSKNFDKYHYLLVNPGFNVSTKWVYENYRLTKKNKNFKLCGSQNNEAGLFDIAELHNDLEQVTVTRYPVVGQIKKILSEAGAQGTLMSGSGPTVFGLFTNRETGETARSRLEQICSKDSLKIISADALTGA